MSINNKWDDFSKADLLEFATKMNLKKPKQIIDQVKEAVAIWTTLAAEYSLSKRQIEQIRKTHRMGI